MYETRVLDLRRRPTIDAAPGQIVPASRDHSQRFPVRYPLLVLDVARCTTHELAVLYRAGFDVIEELTHRDIAR